MKNVTVAMPWRATDDREPAHRRCVAYWSGQGYHVIEADSDPAKSFNRAAARNNAVDRADTNVVILADADTLPAHHNQIRQAVALAESGTAVWPYSVYRLLPADAVTATDLAAVTPVRDYQAKWRPGGLTVITRHAYQAVGGYDERFGSGWGFEDGAFRLACQTLLPVHHLDGVAYAFDHLGARRRDPRNRRRYWWYQRANGNPAQMQRLIIAQRGNINAPRHGDPRPGG